MQITTVGLDLAKRVFQVHAVEASGARHKPETADPRLLALLARKSARVASVAMANKMARVVWAVMARGETYQARHVPILAA
jgi:transposase